MRMSVDLRDLFLYEAFLYYNPLILVTMMVWLWGVNLWVFALASVPYSKIFDLDQNHLTPREIWKMASSALICDTEQWKDLKAHVDDIKKTHLRELMSDSQRCKSMMAEFDGILLDYSRQCATLETMNKLFKLAEAACLKEKINKMFNGERINSTENRSVLHVALRAPRDAVINSDGKNVVPDVWMFGMSSQIRDFSERRQWFLGWSNRKSIDECYCYWYRWQLLRSSFCAYRSSNRSRGY